MICPLRLLEWVNAPGLVAVSWPADLIPGGSSAPPDLATKPAQELCALWDECLTHPAHWAALVSRGWILDALRRRSPRDFEAWMSSGAASPHPFYRSLSTY